MTKDVAYVTQEMWDAAQIDLRHAQELLSNAEPSTDMDNERCSAWLDARGTWLEVVKFYPSAIGIRPTQAQPCNCDPNRWADHAPGCKAELEDSPEQRTGDENG